MSKIKGANTTPEILLRKDLWKNRIRYRIHNPKLPGKPDIVIRKSKLVIFVDGEFWHGFNWKDKKRRIKSNRKYWISKIERNMKRDKRNVRQLKKQGWAVLRFWEHQIKKDLHSCVAQIQFHLK